MDEVEKNFWSLVWKLVAGVIGLLIMLTGAYNIHKDYQRAQALGKNATPAGINCAFDGSPVVCALLVQQGK